jgi:hypothetical protein
MSRLTKRIEKLEGGGKRLTEIVYVPDGLSAAEQKAFAQEYLRNKGLPPDAGFICYDSIDRRL